MKNKLNYYTLFLLYLFLIEFNLFAQDNSKWSVGLEYTIDNQTGSEILNINEFSDRYLINFDKDNYKFGIVLNYNFDKNIFISSGILYANKDFTGNFICVTCPICPVCDIEFLKKGKQRFLSIPISISKQFLQTKIKPSIELGVYNNIELENDLKSYSKHYFLEGFVGVNTNYNFTKNLNAKLGFRYQTSLSNLYSTDDFKFKTTSTYLNINYLIKNKKMKL